MRFLTRLLKRLLALLWMGLVVLLIVAAVSLATARVMFSYAGDYRTEVTAWLSDYLGQPVRVDALDARMQGLQPTLLLKGVRLLDRSGSETLLQSRELRVGIDLWRTLLERRVMLGLLTVVGADLSVLRDAGGRISVAGLLLAQRSGAAAAPDPAAAGSWLFSQARLEIRDSTLYWLDQRGDARPRRFDIARIGLLNQGQRHLLEGVVSLPSGLGESIRVAADFRSAGAVLENWNGEFYVNGLGLELAPLLEQLRAQRQVRASGQLDMELWGRWKDGRLVELHGESGVRELLLRGDASAAPFRLDLANGRFRWRREGSGWELDVPRLQIARGGEWPAARLRLALQRESGGEERWTGQISYLRLQELADLLLATGVLPGQLREALQKMRPRGKLADLRIDYRPQAPAARRFEIATRVRGLHLEPWRRLPGVAGIDATLWADPESGALRLESGAGRVDFPRLARNPWEFEQLRGELGWQKLAGVWYLSAEQLLLRNRDVEAAARLELMIPGADVPPFIDLQVAFRDARVARATHYYPVGIMSPHLVHWLDRALRGGAVPAGELLLHGRLKKGVFPYADGRGTFEVGFEAHDVTLEYHKDWPPIEGLAGEVMFRADGLNIDARRGRIMGTSIAGTHVRISSYRDRMLTVLGQAVGDAGRMLAFLRASPLAPGADPALERMSAAGRATLGLHLGIPFAGHPVEYHGSVTLRDNIFGYRIGDGYLEASNITGRIAFDADGYRSEELEAFILDRPAQLEVSTSTTGDRVTTRIAIDGRLLPAPLARQLGVPLLARLRGESDLRAELDLHYRHHQPGLELELRLDSSLQGITSTLPPPLDKLEPAAQPLHIEWDGGRERIRFAWSGALHGDLGLTSGAAGVRLGGGYLHFGAEDARPPVASALRVTGSLERFSLDEWLRLLPERGMMDASRDLADLNVELELDRLHLLPAASGEGEVVARPRLDPRRLPAFTVGVHDLRYGDLDLGTLAFRSHSGSRGTEIAQLQLTTPYMKIRGDMEWLTDGAQRTSAELTLEALQTHRMLDALGFSAMVHGNDLQLQGTIGWPGTPLDFSLRDLHGQLRLSIGEGYIESMEPGAGRLFGLFSLQALPRRLTLDFRDLFGKGFRFDRIRGEIRLGDGSATTENLLLEGPTARIAVSGRTGYVARDYDQHILVIPGDGSNLFVAGALAWGPQAGALIWMAEKLLRLDKVAQYVYHVTGSWDEPVIVRGREKGAAAPPEGR